MTENSLVNIGDFTGIDEAMQDSSQFCPCCQRSYAWLEDEGSDAAPTKLLCRHTLCSTCIKSQWLDLGSSDDTVFCFTCSKRVGILLLKKSSEEDVGRIAVSHENVLMDDTHLGLNEVIKEESSEKALEITNRNDNLDDSKDIKLHEWVNTSIPENYIFRLVTTGSAEQSMISNTYVLDNGLMVQSSPSQDPIVQNLNSCSTVVCDLEKTSSETNYTSTSDGVTMQSSSMSSPDFNLKALLQMLEKSSETSLGGAAAIENGHFNQIDGLKGYSSINTSESVNCSMDYMMDISANPHIEMESVGITDKKACGQMRIGHSWHSMGMMQPAYVPNQSATLSNTCTMFNQTRNLQDNSEKPGCTPLNYMNSQNSGIAQETGKANGTVWLNLMQCRVPPKSNPRPKRGRKKKPLFRHFQPEFFMRPYLKRENSPQLQLVKLVRQKAQEKKAEEEKVAESIVVSNDKTQEHIEVDKGIMEDPELAFMKTVDMPSGKRVEDIYVVPPVWISSEKNNPVKPNLGKDPHISTSCTGMYNYFPLPAPQRIPIQMYSYGNQGSQYNFTSHTPHIKQYQGYGHQNTAQIQFHPVQIPTLKTLNTTNDSFRPSQNMYKVIKGHIITTLNAPKIGPVPTLKDICKAALGFQTYQPPADASIDGVYSYINSQHQYKPLGHKSKLNTDDVYNEIKSPKEFLDMTSTNAQQELKMAEPKIEAVSAKAPGGKDCVLRDIITLKYEMAEPTFCSTSDSFPYFTEDNIISDIYDTRMADKLSDSEETLPENPIVSENMKHTEKSISAVTYPMDQQITTSSYNYEMQYLDHVSEGSTVKNTGESSSFKDSLKCLYSRNITSGLTTSNSDYVIPIVSYKLKEPVKTSYINNSSKPEVRHQECQYSKGDNHRDTSTRSFNASLFQPSYCPPYFDQQQNGNFPNDQSFPNLTGIAWQIKCLSSFEPLNKQLANLSSALTLLCNAERTLMESNSTIFQQIRSENDSKLGRLNVCIRKLGDFIVTVGWTLQQWSKPTSNRCFKTMGVLTDLYNSNIIGLMELITPYFHYICELMVWNKQSSDKCDHVHCMTNAIQGEQTQWPDLNLTITGSCPKTLPQFSFEETSKSSSPKEFSRQDNEQSLSSEDFMDRESEASNSGHTSAKTSPKIKLMASSKRGRPLGSKNGQRKSRSQSKGQPKRRFNPMSPADSLISDFCGNANPCLNNVLLPNTILVNMSSESFWNDANATILGQTHQTPVHLNVQANGLEEMVTHPKFTSSTKSSWVLPRKDMASHLNIAIQSSGTMEEDYQSNIEVTEVMNGSTSKDTSTDNSPVKKAKLDDECQALVYEMPANASSILEASDLQSYQDSIYYIKAENSDNELFSTGLMGSLKNSKETADSIQIAFLQDCSAGVLDSSIKTLRESSLLAGLPDHSKLISHLSGNLGSDLGMNYFPTHSDPGNLCRREADMNGSMMDLCVSEDHSVIDSLSLCPTDGFDMDSNDNTSILPTTSFDEHLE